MPRAEDVIDHELCRQRQAPGGYFESLTPDEVAAFEAMVTEDDLEQVAGAGPTTGSGAG